MAITMDEINKITVRYLDRLFVSTASELYRGTMSMTYGGTVNYGTYNVPYPIRYYSFGESEPYVEPMPKKPAKPAAKPLTFPERKIKLEE